MFENGVSEVVWDLTEGQPWLVNALAYEACFEIRENRDRSRIITVEMIRQAKENLILRRQTHLDQLTDKLREPRVRQVIEVVFFNWTFSEICATHTNFFGVRIFFQEEILSCRH